jgi:glycosyltransferase involved in cell wall biosynthesis
VNSNPTFFQMINNTCIISSYFLESTVPLAKNISESVKTDLILVLSRRNTNAFIFNLSPNTKPGFIKESETSKLLAKFKEYLNSINKIKIFVLTGRTLKHPIDTLLVFYLCFYLWRKKYSVIHIIGQNPRFVIIHFLFRKKIVQTFHEYASHNLLEKDNNSQSWLSLYPKKFIFHSQYVRAGFKEKPNQMAEVIPYGLFETFSFSPGEECFEIGNNNVTIIGIIRPYKGIQLFIDSINILIDKGINISPVIAGRGDLDLYSFKYKDRFTIINQELSDSQFCEIIRKSYIVVCPYLSASQSGIPMVAHLFHKPVVATKVGAFPEYISDNRLLVDLNALHLANIIEKLLTDLPFYKEVVSMQDQTYLNSKTWEKIAKKTIDFYNL